MARMIYYPNEGLAVEGEGEGDAEVGEAVDKIHGSVGKAGVSAGLGMHDGGLNPGGGNRVSGEIYPSIGSQMKVGASVNRIPGA